MTAARGYSIPSRLVSRIACALKLDLVAIVHGELRTGGNRFDHHCEDLHARTALHLDERNVRLAGMAHEACLRAAPQCFNVDKLARARLGVQQHRVAAVLLHSLKRLAFDNGFILAETPRILSYNISNLNAGGCVDAQSDSAGVIQLQRGVDARGVVAISTQRTAVGRAVDRKLGITAEILKSVSNAVTRITVSNVWKVVPLGHFALLNRLHVHGPLDLTQNEALFKSGLAKRWLSDV
jgi:hypothetical protein